MCEALPNATYLINAFGEELLMQLQLNAHRLVVVYRVPALDALDASTLAVRLCQCLPPYQTVDAAFTAVAALAHPEGTIDFVPAGWSPAWSTLGRATR
jgi:hypothetical protein